MTIFDNIEKNNQHTYLSRLQYDALKQYRGSNYSGMRIGGGHEWQYQKGIWRETKMTPDQWEIQFTCRKQRLHHAPTHSGALMGTDFHWFIMADQIATKVNEDVYETNLFGLKFKIGHKKPSWKNFSYTYPGQFSYKERVIKILESYLNALKHGQSLEFCFSPMQEPDW